MTTPTRARDAFVTLNGARFHSRIADGRVAEEWEIMDRLGLLQQLGAMPAPQVAPSAAP